MLLTVEQTLAHEAARRGLTDLRLEPLGILVRLRMGQDLGIWPARELARRLARVPAEVTGRAALTAATTELFPLRGEWMALPGSGGLRFSGGKPVELNLASKTPEQAQLRAEEILGAWLRVDTWRGSRVECRVVDRPNGYRVSFAPRTPFAPRRTEIVYVEDGCGWALPASGVAQTAVPHRVIWTLRGGEDPCDPETWRIIRSNVPGQDIRHQGYTWQYPPRDLAVEPIAPFAVMPVVPPLRSAPRNQVDLARVDRPA